MQREPESQYLCIPGTPLPPELCSLLHFQQAPCGHAIFTLKKSAGNWTLGVQNLSKQRSLAEQIHSQFSSLCSVATQSAFHTLFLGYIYICGTKDEMVGGWFQQHVRAPLHIISIHEESELLLTLMVSVPDSNFS